MRPQYSTSKLLSYYHRLQCPIATRTLVRELPFCCGLLHRASRPCERRRLGLHCTCFLDLSKPGNKPDADTIPTKGVVDELVELTRVQVQIAQIQGFLFR